MRIGKFMGLLGAVALIFGFTAPAWPRDEVVVSSKVGECSLAVEADLRWHTLRLRAHHPEGRNCLIDKDSVLAILERAFSEDGWMRSGEAFTSISIGRLIDYPWLCLDLALAAQRDKKWDARKGKPVTVDINRYVSRILSENEGVSRIRTVIAGSRYRITGVSVEKVLVGKLSEVPQYTGTVPAGRYPFDAQVWFRLEWAGPGKE